MSSTREVIEAAVADIEAAKRHQGAALTGTRDALQALLNDGLEVERNAVYELGQKVGRTDGADQMRERCGKADPRSVPCPLCQAKIGKMCRQATGINLHAARWRASIRNLSL